MQKKTFLFIVAAVTAAGIVAALIYYANFNPLISKSLAANESGGDYSFSKLNLTSIRAYDVNHSRIGEIEPNQSFKTNHPVLIQTEFSNLDINSGEYIVASEIRGDSETASFTTVQVDIAGLGSVSIEAYWKPEQAGNYSLLIFAYKPEELDRGPVIAPIKIIPLRAVE